MSWKYRGRGLIQIIGLATAKQARDNLETLAGEQGRKLSKLVLTGCAGREPEVCTVRVEVPVLVSCKTKEVSVPSWAAAGLKSSDSLEVKVRALLAERRQRIGYERQLGAAVGACR